MRFPTSFRHSIKVPWTGNTYSDSFINLLSAELTILKGKNIVIEGHVVTFTGGIFRPVWSTNLLVPISTGKVEIINYSDYSKIIYEIKFSQIIIVNIILSILSIVFGLCKQNIESTIIILLVVWILLFGFNVTVAIITFNRFIKDISKN